MEMTINKFAELQNRLPILHKKIAQFGEGSGFPDDFRVVRNVKIFCFIIICLF